jgi:hypothetical protein
MAGKRGIKDPDRSATTTVVAAEKVAEADTVEPEACATVVPSPKTAPPMEPIGPVAASLKHAAPGQSRPDTVLHLEVICGGITKVKVPVVIGAHYQGIPLAGVPRAFDRQLDFWLTRAIGLGMIASGLGQLFRINLRLGREADRFVTDDLLLIGMGEPGHFAADDLRYLMSNATVAVKAMRQNHFATALIGARREELSVESAVRGLVEGVLDGYERFRALLEDLTHHREEYEEVANQALKISLVETNEDRAEKILLALQALEAQSKDHLIKGLQLEADRGEDVPSDPDLQPGLQDANLNMPTTLLRVTRNEQSSGTSRGIGTAVFQYSAFTDQAATTVREVEVNSYFVRELPRRLTSVLTQEEQENFGTFFANYLIPDECRRLLDGGKQVTLVVDNTTAAYPWEMAAFRKHSRTSFLGTDFQLSRQFHSLLSPVPASPPPVNHTLNILLIADPAPRDYAPLPGARAEALAVVDIFKQVQQAWKQTYDLHVTVRIGSQADEPELQELLKSLAEQRELIVSAKVCDPVEVAMLVVNNSYDVIHYAGHGVFDKKSGQSGWLFDRDCILSAPEIFRIRQVPRLVFANACFSSATADPTERSQPGTSSKPEDYREQLVGLAQAFFARGIPNYIGAGWKVGDELARECARWFYSRVLGLRRPPTGGGVSDRPDPATLGDALSSARSALLQKQRETDPTRQSSTWGAYQHYGRACDRLLARVSDNGHL